MEENLKSLFIDGLIMSIKPNVRRYWADNLSSDIDSLGNYAQSSMPIIRMGEYPRYWTLKRRL